MRFPYIFFVTFILCFVNSSVVAKPRAVILLRHGEEPKSGDSLSKDGWLRAKRLPLVFERTAISKFGEPVALFAAKPEFEGQSQRSIQTLRYVGEKFKLKIQSDFTKDEVKKLVKKVNEEDDYDDKLVVISWPHRFLEEIAEEFGADKIKKYPDEKFDRLWVLEFPSSKNKKVEFHDLPQRLLMSDDAV